MGQRLPNAHRPGAACSLVIAPQWIGDAVMTEPLIRRLQARGERVTVAALPHISPIYQAMDSVSHCIDLPFAHGRLDLKARRSLAKQLIGRFDVAFVLPNSFKSALLPWLASIPKRIGYLGEARVGLLTHRLKNPSKGARPAMVPFYSALSGDAPADIATDRPHLQIETSQSRDTLAQLGLPAHYFIFAPGSEYGPAKRWPASHFAELANKLGQPVLLLGSAKEAALCADIAAHAPNCINLAGKTTLTQAIALLSCAQAVVSNDSGLMHVAAALGTPQVAIFGSSSPLHTPPLNDTARVLWLKQDPGYLPALDCAPCFSRDCPLGHTRCLSDISALHAHQLLLKM
jgi:heptosyltransferase II